MSAPIALALSQVHRIGSLCDFLETPGLQIAISVSVPVSMPQSEGSMGFDTPLWVGLGIVGLWSAIDAYAERSGIPLVRCSACRRKRCLSSRLASTGTVGAADIVALQELEDLRHLFAHNFAGQADQPYFHTVPRHALVQGAPSRLSSGAAFDGQAITLSASHLKYYAEHARGTLQAQQ